jgi:ATP/ADP translocase
VPRLLDIGVGNGRQAMAAALTLFALLAAHTVLEVARDALFLANLPAEQLPFTYLAIAGAAWLAARVDRVLLTRFDKRRVSAITLLAAAAGTAAFRFAFASGAWWVPHAFYVWTGLVATFAVAQFWRLLADLFTVGEARTLYARIAAGGSLGAVTGAALASLAQRWLEPSGLLFVGAGLLALTALVPGLCISSADTSSAAPPRRRRGGATDGRGYVLRLAALVALAAVSATLVDYVFKATIDAELAPDELGPFFSRFYVVLNIVALVVQLVLAPRLLDLLGANRALVVLPMLLALGAVGAAAAGGLAAAMLLRGTDGSLRHSLHRSALELLYLPLSTAMRDRYKALIDAIGQRGGQAFGSVTILGVTALGAGPEELALAVAGLGVGWVALALSMRKRYLDLFRANLRAGTIETRAEVPDLDLHSLESLVASLNSERDEEVLATLDLLADYDRVHLVPALLLYHPSRAVVLRTLDLLADTGRTDFVPVARRLLERDDAEVQAAAMRALARLLAPEELRGELERGHAASVRAAVLVALVARGLDEDGRARAEMDRCARSHRGEVRLALARAIRLQADPALTGPLHAMIANAAEEEPELRREIARAFGTLRDARALPILIEWLGPRGARAECREALTAIGEPALDALEAALNDETLPRALRAHVPRTISRFRSPRAAQILFARLPDEPDGWVRYKILRGLRALREARSDLRFEPERLHALTRRDLVRATGVLARRVAVERAHQRDPSLKTRAGELLAPVLREKEAQALDRAVRLIALEHPREDLRRLTHALRHGDRRLRAESRELLTALAPFELAGALDALLDDAPDARRLARARESLDAVRPPSDYTALLRELVVDESEAVRSIAAHHAAELRLTELSEPLEAGRARSKGMAREVIARALAVLAEPEEVGGVGT